MCDMLCDVLFSVLNATVELILSVGDGDLTHLNHLL